MKINILHLYYDIMNLYNEYDNVLALKNELENQGISPNISKKTISDEIDLEEYDFIYIGCGTESNLNYVLDNLKKYTLQLKSSINNNKFFLCTGNSFEMFGEKIGKIDGLGIFDFECNMTEHRIVSDVIYETLDEEKIQIVGCVNKMSMVYHNMHPLFKVIKGVGENNKNDYEGIKYNNFYGTQVLGPLLINNPNFLVNLAISLKSLVK